MSELINNREHRKKMVKEVIKELHKGATVDDVKGKFAEAIKGVSPSEITAIEGQLVKEGLPVEEIQRLCNVHAAVFKGSIEEIHHPDQVPGHPIYTLREENEAIKKYIEEHINPNLEKFKEEDSKENINSLKQDIDLLWDIDKHYSRKENLVFPYLEKYEIITPPKVMWGVDDEIRTMLKEIKLMLTDYRGNKDEVVEKVENVVYEINEMVYKEEKILFPMALETLSEDEWISVYNDSDEIGYTLIEPQTEWEVKRAITTKGETVSEEGSIKFETGVLSIEELESMLNTVPGDMTFIDKDDVVKYFSQGKERIFARTKTVIGRTVQNCHPPASVHVVEKILEDFKSGKKDEESFWIKMGDVYVYIRYFAVRDKNGEYLGTLEFTQNIKPIQEIEGEKRLLSE
ncbi:DUF438 domain-containing protein [Schnuerera sp. xch1]|uniref:DUF438 domain-containing protein n=1 Tax=Schnuerera sp. xch1 TaxID=2874283 RepID=UPI001CBBC69E|nr:DUF438 domain-containing protein [Schnuerera sp. xch1]MBZ2175979.1 DUF438 domain-containing protein [Schnuerera sp. xch1]